MQNIDTVGKDNVRITYTKNSFMQIRASRTSLYCTASYEVNIKWQTDTSDNDTDTDLSQLAKT
jgi:hypothetical protein